MSIHLNILQKRKFNFFLVVLIAIIIVTLIITSFIGLNLEDEGFYAILSNPFQEYIYSPVNFDLVYKWIYNLFDLQFDISQLRLLRIIFNLLGSFIFYLGAKSLGGYYKILRSDKSTFLLIIILLSFLSNYNLPILTIGYNEFAFFGIQLFSGTLLILMYKKNQKISFILLEFTIIYIGYILLFISKPTGIPFIFLFSFLLVVFDFKYDKLWIFTIIWVSILTVEILFPLNPRLQINSLLKVFNIMRESSTSHSFSNLFKNLINGSVVLLISFFLGYFNLQIKKISIYLKLVFILIIGAAITYDCYQFITNNQRVLNLFAYYITVKINYIISIVLAFYYGIKISSISRDDRLINIFYFSLSVLLCLSIYFGTDNYLMYIFPKAFVFFILALIPIYKDKVKPFHYFLVLLLLFKFFFNLVFFNFYLRKSMFSQTHLLKYGRSNSSKMYVDDIFLKNQLAFNKQINKYSEKFVLGLDRLETYIYLSGKVYPGSILWADEDLHDFFNYRFSRPKSFILVIRGGQFDKLKSYLQDYSISLYAKELMTMYAGTDVDFNFYYCIKK